MAKKLLLMKTSYHKETLKLALPILGTHLAEALVPFINTALAASLGETALAAAGLVSTAFFAVMGFCWGIVSTVGIITANKLGANTAKPSQIGIVLWAGFLTALLLSLPIMWLFNHISIFWNFFGQNPTVVPLGQTYFNGLLWAVFADLAKFAIFQFAIACNKPKIPLIANLASTPILLICNSFLIKRYGLYGLGLGTALIYWLVFAAMLIYIMRNSDCQKYLCARNRCRDYLHMCLQQFKLGAPIGLMFSIELLFFAVLALMMGKISTQALAANQIALQWLWPTLMLCYGFTEAATILVAKANGARDVTGIRQFTRSSVLLSSLVLLSIALVYWFLPNLLIQFDLNTNSSAELFILAKHLLLICGCYQLIDNLRTIMAGVLRGMTDTQFPFWATAVAFWGVGLPIGYWCGFGLGWDGPGLWAGLIAAALTGVILQFYRLRYLVQQRKNTKP